MLGSAINTLSSPAAVYTPTSVNDNGCVFVAAYVFV